MIDWSAFTASFGAPRAGTGVALGALALLDADFLVDFVGSVGGGIFRDGLLSIASVREKRVRLGRWEHVVPIGSRLIATSGLGDLFVYTPRGRVQTLFTQIGLALEFPGDPAQFFADFLPQPNVRKTFLKEALVSAARGKLADREVFIHTPVPALGGPGCAEDLRPCSIDVYLSLVAQLVIPSRGEDTAMAAKKKSAAKKQPKAKAPAKRVKKAAPKRAASPAKRPAKKVAKKSSARAPQSKPKKKGVATKKASAPAGDRSEPPAVAEQEVRRAAEAGDPNAQLQLGKHLFWSPDGDAEASIAWLTKAAEAGVHEATYMLGLAWYRGRGVSEADPVRARALHMAAAESGVPDAQFEISIFLDKGIGGEVDHDRARVWEKRAADAGHPRACLNMGVWAATGKFGAPDMDAAVRWYGRAADNGSAEAASRLALMYLQGLGVEKDEERGRRWFEHAASLGYDWSARLG